MDDFDNPQIPDNQDFNKPIPFDDDDDLNKTIPFDDSDTVDLDLSQTPLATGKEGSKSPQMPAVKKPEAKKSSEDSIKKADIPKKSPSKKKSTKPDEKQEEPEPIEEDKEDEEPHLVRPSSFFGSWTKK